MLPYLALALCTVYPALACVLLPGCGLLMLALMTAISADVADHIFA